VIHGGRTDVEGRTTLDTQTVQAAGRWRRALVAVVIPARRRILCLGAADIGTRRPEDEQHSPVAGGRAGEARWSARRGQASIAEAGSADRSVARNATSGDGSPVTLSRRHRATAVDIETRSGERAFKVGDAGLQIQRGPTGNVDEAIPWADRAAWDRAASRLQHLGPGHG